MRRCNRCVMDDHGDKYIVFDSEGNCNYCSEAIRKMPNELHLDSKGQSELSAMLDRIREDGKNSKYDCIVGVSGGLDSSYLLYQCYKWNLRVLAVHIDDGYDTDISKENIKKLIEKTAFDFKVICPDKYQYNELLKAFMKSGVSNLDMPQDNILFANLYDYAIKENLKYFVSGHNFATESILQKGEIHNGYDEINIRSINKRFGEAPIDKLQFMGIMQRNLIVATKGIKTVHPLDYVDYNREKAFKELEEFCGFQYYGRKHLENKLTAFIQLYWFPKKFGVDKRKSHLSSLIVSGQMTREEALKELEEPLYDEDQMREYIDLIKKNTGLSDEEFTEIMDAPTHEHMEYASEMKTYRYKLAMLIWPYALKLYHFIRQKGKGF